MYNPIWVLFSIVQLYIAFLCNMHSMHSINIIPHVWSLPYHAGQRGTAVSFVAWGPPKTSLPIFGVLLPYPVPPVAAHPLGEVPIIVLIIVHNKRGKQPKRQLGNRCAELSVRLLSPVKKKRTRVQPAYNDPAGSGGLLLLLLSWSF